MTIIHSYTSLANWRLCPRLHYEQHVRKSLPFVETEAMRRGKEMHSALEAALRDGADPPTGYGVPQRLWRLLVEFGARAEVPIAMTRDGRGCGFFDKDNVWVRGKIDVYLSALHRSACIMVDWKSGNPNYTDELQARVYGAMIGRAVPGITKTLFLWSYPKAGKTKPLTVDNEKAWREVGQLAKRVEADEAHPPRPGWKCKWCAVKWCEYNRTEER